MTVSGSSARHWAAVGALCLLRHAEAGGLRSPSPGYDCTLWNGTRVMSAHDISTSFPDSVRACSGTGGRVAWTVLEGKLPRTLGDPLFKSDSEPAAAAVSKPTAWQELTPQPRPPSGRARVTAFDDLILDACARHGVDPHLVQAVIHVESAHQPHARSSKGALGLMQVMPATGVRYGVSHPRQLLEPELNIDVGTRYLRDLHKLFGGRIELVLAAYNAGEGAVARYGNRIPPYSETREYVRRALLMYRQRQLQPSGPQRLNRK